MKRMINIFTFFTIGIALCASCSDDETNVIEYIPDEVEAAIDMADPFIMLDGDTYYAYGTKASNGIACYSSDDLVHWNARGLALHNYNSYGESWFWAPEVYKVGDRYLMYYSADEHICVAEGKSPVGPFVQKEQVSMLPDEKAIDNTLFIDDDGTPYLYFDRYNDGINVWVAKLNEDLLTIDESTMTHCIKQSQQWEFEGVNEGPCVVKHGDTYYMTYSGNGYTNAEYGIGLATSKSPMGPWTKYSGNPIFQFPQTIKYGRLAGVGHCGMFTDKDGNLRIVFHAHKIPGQGDVREMYISTVSFTDHATPLMQISSSDVIKAVLKK